MLDETSNAERRSTNILPGSEYVVKAGSSSFTSAQGCKPEQNLLDFAEMDPEDPLNWPYWRKLTIQLLVACMFMLGNFGTLIIIPAVPRLIQDLHVTEEFYSTLVVSIWELGEVVGPFIVAPLSEKFGRLPVYHTGNVLFVLFLAVSALSTNIHTLVALRFFSGLTTTSMTLGPSIIGDCFSQHQRGRSMIVAIAIPQIAPFAAPIVGGYLTETLGWRWSIWITTITAGMMTLISGALFKETYKPVILERKIRRLKSEAGDITIKSKYHALRSNESLFRSLTRPFRLLTSPIILVVCIYNALVYGMSYLILTTLAIIFQSQQYGFSEGQSGLTFLGRGIGSLAGILFYGLTSDRYLEFISSRRGKSEPEDRLPYMLCGSILIAVGILLYGWSIYFDLAWIVPIVGTAIIGFSMLITMLSAQNYLVDVFELYAASAVAISNAFSALFGAFFPLCSRPLYGSLGLGWGNTTLALMFLMWAPALATLQYFGRRIRESPRFGVAKYCPTI